MRLAITNEQVDHMVCVQLRPQDLNFNSAHAVVASQVWDECYIDLDECIEEGKLRYMPNKCRAIYPRFPDSPSRHQMILLTELFPALTGAIRKAFLKGDDLHGILPTVWEQGLPPGRDDMQVPPRE